MTMLENPYLLLAIATFLGLVVAGYIFRTGYTNSLKAKNSDLNEVLGKNINRLACAKISVDKLEKLNEQLLSQINNAQKVNDELTKSNMDLSEQVTAYKTHLSEQVKENETVKQDYLKLEKQYIEWKEDKEQELNRSSNSQQKVTHSFEILQRNLKNLRKERDFYRQEFIRLRDSDIESAGLPKSSELAELKVG